MNSLPYASYQAISGLCHHTIVDPFALQVSRLAMWRNKDESDLRVMIANGPFLYCHLVSTDPGNQTGDKIDVEKDRNMRKHDFVDVKSKICYNTHSRECIQSLVVKSISGGNGNGGRNIVVCADSTGSIHSHRFDDDLMRHGAEWQYANMTTRDSKSCFVESVGLDSEYSLTSCIGWSCLT
jgi:hypothetical protein